jgi:hypothetical protein
MRQLFHILVGIAFWLLLAGLWVLLAVEGKASGAAFRDTGVWLAALMGAVLAVTIWWIRHNVATAARGRAADGPRTRRAPTRTALAATSNGRCPVAFPPLSPSAT